MSSMMLGFGLMFLGMFVVFAVLVLLFLSMVVLGRLARREARVATVAVAPVPNEEGNVPDNRVVAAISVALSEYLRMPGGIRLGKISRVQRPSRSWAAAGRLEIINGRLSGFERTGQ